MALLTFGDPVTTAIASVSQAIVAIADLGKVMAQSQSPEQIQKITQDTINLLAPFNRLIEKLDKKLGIDTEPK